MQLPSVDDVNQTRLSRFDDAITAALEDTDKIDFFRDVVKHYVNEHDVPEVDVAAALVAVMQGDQPLLLDPKQEVLHTPRERDDRGGDRRDKGGRPDRGDRRPDRGPRQQRDDLVTYRISVGKRHKVEPRQIVGALANEGGLGRSDFGRIDIRMDHSLVDLPASLPSGAWDKLKETRISGKLIELARDNGPKREGGYKKREGGYDKSEGGYKKPRHRG